MSRCIYTPCILQNGHEGPHRLAESKCMCLPVVGCAHFELDGCRQLDALYAERNRGAEEAVAYITAHFRSNYIDHDWIQASYVADVVDDLWKRGFPDLDPMPWEESG